MFTSLSSNIYFHLVFSLHIAATFKSQLIVFYLIFSSHRKYNSMHASAEPLPIFHFAIRQSHLTGDRPGSPQPSLHPESLSRGTNSQIQTEECKQTNGQTDGCPKCIVFVKLPRSMGGAHLIRLQDYKTPFVLIPGFLRCTQSAPLINLGTPSALPNIRGTDKEPTSHRSGFLNTFYLLSKGISIIRLEICCT